MDVHGGGGVMIRAGVCYERRPQVHFFDDILNGRRYHGENLRPVVVRDNARPYVSRIYTQSLEAENIPVPAWPAFLPNMSPIKHDWDALDQHIQQRAPVLPISSNFTPPLKRSEPTFHRQQSTT